MKDIRFAFISTSFIQVDSNDSNSSVLVKHEFEESILFLANAPSKTTILMLLYHRLFDS